MSFEIGQRVWERDRGGDGIRGGTIIEVNHEQKLVVCVEAYSKPKARKAEVHVAVLKFESIDRDMVEDTAPHERGLLVRALLRRMGERNHALRTREDERDIAAIDALWSA